MKLITIKEPIWYNKSVGIADNKLTENIIRIRISYKTKDGERLYPEDFIITKKQAQSYYLAPAKGRRPALRMIPISDLEEMTRNFL